MMTRCTASYEANAFTQTLFEVRSTGLWYIYLSVVTVLYIPFVLMFQPPKDRTTVSLGLHRKVSVLNPYF